MILVIDSYALDKNLDRLRELQSMVSDREQKSMIELVINGINQEARMLTSCVERGREQLIEEYP